MGLRPGRRAAGWAAGVLLLVAAMGVAWAQEGKAAADAHTMKLDVVVAPKSGVPVAGLQRQDFTVLDNGVAQPITSFAAMGGPEAPIEVLLVIDSVNTRYLTIAKERDQVERFLKANGGLLPYPTSLAFVTDTGTQVQKGFIRDGNALSAALDRYSVGLRAVRRSSQYEADERIGLSLTALKSVVDREAARPGRKIIVWISPGWPMLSGLTVDLSYKQEQGLFAEITGMSAELREGHITLDSVNPLGPGEGVERMFYYQAFVKGVTKLNHVQQGDLGLQVLAAQSGGLVLGASNDISSLLERCVEDGKAYYAIAYTAPPSEHANEYHKIEVRVANPRLKARTRTGYYGKP